MKPTIDLDHKKYIGMNAEEVMKDLTAAGIKVRIKEEDGKCFVGTRDFVPERINIKITKGIITHANRG